ncbi:MAG: hypothetical protein VX899_08055 [Myxococcota bacterium]|nr:hypothetical protein [Myxococcota bacterium]
MSLSSLRRRESVIWTLRRPALQKLVLLALDRATAGTSSASPEELAHLTGVSEVLAPLQELRAANLAVLGEDGTWSLGPIFHRRV